MPTQPRSSTTFSTATLLAAALALGAVAPDTHAQSRRHAPVVANAEPIVAPFHGTPPIAPHDGAVVQVALLLDTSNSMDGLIEQAKAALWRIVNELTTARADDGSTPQVRVAVYEYGNDGIPAGVGHVRQRIAFTTDLDLVSEQLFGLRTNGGSEFCGRVIDTAVDELVWLLGPDDPHVHTAHHDDPRPEASLEDAALGAVAAGIQGQGHHHGPHTQRSEHPVVRMIVIAGNEPFTQGATAYAEAIADARALNVTVSTIHCGPTQVGIEGEWQRGAQLGGGLFACIDQNTSVVEPPTPYDERIGALTSEINGTYLAYNRADAELARGRQTAQDSFNESGGFAAGRAGARAGGNYRAGHWDVVDAVRRDGVDLDSIDDAELPDALRGLDAEARTARIDELWAQRQMLQEQLRTVLAERRAFLDEHQRANAPTGTLDDAITRGVRDQAEAAGLRFEDEPTPDAPSE